MERRMKKFSVLFEIFLVISIVIITPYDLSNLFGNNVVSAVDPMKIVNTIQNFMNDEKNKINTCAELVDGNRCLRVHAMHYARADALKEKGKKFLNANLELA